jgi:hypothetical protein
MSLGGGVWSIQFLISIPVLSDPTNSFVLVGCGVCEGPGTSESNNFLGVRYTHSDNGGRFLALARSGGVPNGEDTGVTVEPGDFISGAEYEVEWIVDPSASSADCIINGGSPTTVTGGIPTSPVALLAMQVFTTNGTGGSGRIDWFKPTFIAEDGVR